MFKPLPLLLAGLLLASCGTTTSPQPGLTAPTAPDALCPPSIAVRSDAEPLPPAGVDREAVMGALVDALGEPKAKAFWEWLTVTWPGWGREGWGRVDQARKACPD